MYCKNCGYKLDDGSEFCPNCGKKLERVAAETVSDEKDANAKSVTVSGENGARFVNAEKTEPKGVNALAIAGFVVSLLSLGLGYFYAIASVAGLVLSAIGVGIRKKYSSCNGLAVAGLIIGIISTIIWIVVWLYVYIVILALASIGRSL